VNVVVVETVVTISRRPATAEACGLRKVLFCRRQPQFLGLKKTRQNFTIYYPIFNFFSLADSAVNLQQIHV